ncbi:MAG: UTP--glucose-1-phosphate uridylyltransferase, partial [Candidatus Omnitrophota bacterium]
KLVSVLIYEKKIDFNVVDKERAALIDAITKKLDKDQLAELVNKSLEFKVGKISSVEYYNYLRALAAKYGITLSSEYPNLFNYIIYNSVYSRIENEHLFNDIKKFEEALKERMFADDDQRTLDKLSRHINILLGLTNIKLLNGDFDYYKERKEEFSHEVFAGFINRMAAKFGFAYEIDPPSEAVVESMPKLEDFYAIAIKRDKALVDNTMQAMKKENAQISVLVTGGFHSEGITKLLEKQGVSYLVICPNITKDVETPYIKILTNQRTPLEEILSDTGAATADAKNVKGSMLAPYLITAARIKAVDHLIDERTEDVLDAWATRSIAPWLIKAQRDAAEKKLPFNASIAAARFKIDVGNTVDKYKKRHPELTRVQKNTLAENAKRVTGLAPAIIERHLKVQALSEGIGAIRGNGGEAILVLVKNKPALNALENNIRAGVIQIREQLEVVRILLEIGQGHLFAKWDAPGANDDLKRAFLDQIVDIHNQYSGGLAKYYADAKTNLDIWKKKENSFKGRIPKKADGIDITSIEKDGEFHRLERSGLRSGNKLSFVLVAGGLGQRLGFKGIKVNIPISLAMIQSYLETYVRNISEIQKKSNAINGTRDSIPLVIMTSGETHELTLKALEEQDYFSRYGMAKEQFIVIQQPPIPSIMDADGNFGLKGNDPYKLQTSPHGHGDIHMLLARRGLIKKWVTEGRTHTVFMQDTQVQLFNVILAALGVSLENKLDFNMLTATRPAGEKTGAIVKLEDPKTGKYTVQNVEYNLLDALLKSAGLGGDTADETGSSPFPGNLNILIARNEPYAQIPDLDKGIMPEMINPKFPNPARPETLMQDLAIFMDPKHVSYTNFPKEYCFSPAKNSLEEGRKVQAGTKGNADTVSTAEGHYYWSNRKKLRIAGMHIGEPGNADSHGINYRKGALIVLTPDFALTLDDVISKVKGGAISDDSALIIDGEDVRINNINLDGALVIKTAPGVKLTINRLDVKNAGWHIVNLTEAQMTDETIPQHERMRGYRLVRKEGLVIDISKAGEYVIDDNILTGPDVRADLRNISGNTGISIPGPDASASAKRTEWPRPEEVIPDKRIVMLISGGEAPGVNEYFWRDAEMHAELGYSVEVMHFGLKGLLKGKLEVGNNGRTWVNWERARGIEGMPGAFAGTSRVKMSKSEIFKMLWDAADYTRTLEFIGGNDHLGEAAKVGEIINQITGAENYADFKGGKEEFVEALKDILNKADISQSEIESVFNELHK